MPVIAQSPLLLSRLPHISMLPESATFSVFFRKRFFSRTSATACFSCSFPWRSSMTSLDVASRFVSRPVVSSRPQEIPCSTGSRDSTESLRVGTALRCSLPLATLPTRSAPLPQTNTSSASSDESTLPDALPTLSPSFDPPIRKVSLSFSVDSVRNVLTGYWNAHTFVDTFES